MHPWDIFDICHELCRKYRLLRAQAPAAHNLLIPSGKGPPTRSRPMLSDYLVDFELAGRRALNQPSWEPRRRLFQTYYMEDTSYQGTLKLLRIRPDVFDYWSRGIKEHVGKELARAGIYPPDRYFRGAE